MKSIELKIPVRNSYIPATLALPEAEHFPICALIHGFQGDRHENGSNTALAALLALSDIGSIRMDFSGCGDSPESFMLCTLSNMVSDVCLSVNTAVSDYGANPQSVGLMGLSLGGRVIMEILNNNLLPGVRAVSLSSPAATNGPLMGIAGGEQQWSKNYAYAREHGFFMHHSDFAADVPLSPEWFEQLMEADSLGNAKPFEGKMQVILAEDDVVVPPDISRRCAAAYGAQIVEISGDGHSFGIYSARKDICERRNAVICDFFRNSLL